MSECRHDARRISTKLRYACKYAIGVIIGCQQDMWDTPVVKRGRRQLASSTTTWSNHSQAWMSRSRAGFDMEEVDKRCGVGATLITVPRG
jgi:hypothetical protein